MCHVYICRTVSNQDTEDPVDEVEVNQQSSAGSPSTNEEEPSVDSEEAILTSSSSLIEDSPSSSYTTSKEKTSSLGVSKKTAMVGKRKRMETIDLVEREILSTLSSLKAPPPPPPPPVQECDEEDHFVASVASTLRRFSPRMKALAKVKIQELLLNLEFPPQQVPLPPLPMTPFCTPGPVPVYTEHESGQDIHPGPTPPL